MARAFAKLGEGVRRARLEHDDRMVGTGSRMRRESFGDLPPASR